MGSNSFGQLFKITTWGESHGPAIGVVIDGCPAGLPLTEADIQKELDLRRPGDQPYVSSRKERDHAEILSGLFEGETTGAPLSILIRNHDVMSAHYEPIKSIYRPGHANYTYLQKYGVFDYRGGGRASARETACRVAAGAVAKKILAHEHIPILAYLKAAAGLCCPPMDWETLVSQTKKSALFCPCPQTCLAIIDKLKERDSFGGIVEFIAHPPPGLGDPVYEKLEANLGKAFLSLPASRGVEFGLGFAAAAMRGSEHNDLFVCEEGIVKTSTNHAGGILGGISNGMPLIARVAFKPTSSIPTSQKTLDIDHKEIAFTLPEGSRHDPCLSIRAVPVVEAMGAIVLADALLMHRLARM